MRAAKISEMEVRAKLNPTRVIQRVGIFKISSTTLGETYFIKMDFYQAVTLKPKRKRKMTGERTLWINYTS